MASDKFTFDGDGEEVEFEVTEWSGVLTLAPGFVFIPSGWTLLLLPAGCAGLN